MTIHNAKRRHWNEKRRVEALEAELARLEQEDIIEAVTESVIARMKEAGLLSGNAKESEDGKN